jgi:hypothetical protein
MRVSVGLAVLLLPLLLVLPGTAQQNRPAESFFTGISPRDIQFKNVNTGQMLKPADLSKFMHPQRQMTPINASRAFHTVSSTSYTPKRVSAPIVNGKNNPFQPNPPKGFSLLNLLPKFGK